MLCEFAPIATFLAPVVSASPEYVPTKKKAEPSKGKKEWTSEEIRRMKPHEFEKYEKEIDLARREGRIR